MYVTSKGKVNPLIGAAGVSAVPMAARVVQESWATVQPLKLPSDARDGPNVAGVIGSAIAAGLY